MPEHGSFYFANEERTARWEYVGTERQGGEPVEIWDYQVIRVCALCGTTAWVGFSDETHREWQVSSIRFLGWWWCAEHATIGAEFDQSMVQTFSEDAKAMLMSLVERMERQAGVARGTYDHGRTIW